MVFFRCATIKQSGGGEGYKITVTTPVGSTVTVSKDQVSFSDTVGQSGSVEFIVPTTGTWSIVASLDGKTASRTVEVVANDISIDYSFSIYDYGVEGVALDLTGYNGSSSMTKNSSGVTKQSDYINVRLGSATKSYYCSFGTASKVNLSSYSNLHVDYTVSGTAKSIDVDISDITDSCYISIWCQNSAGTTIYQNLNVYASLGKSYGSSFVQKAQGALNSVKATTSLYYQIKRIYLS